MDSNPKPLVQRFLELLDEIMEEETSSDDSKPREREGLRLDKED